MPGKQSESYTNSNCNVYTCTDCYCHRNRNSHCDRYSNGSSESNSYSYSNGDCDPDAFNNPNCAGLHSGRQTKSGSLLEWGVFEQGGHLSQ